jgi:2-polyprenyl-3-methyl-5-hydroxy-6-metoxy-1,4-benzoquinol methylase
MPKLTIDPRLKRHDLGFLELINKPSKAELADYYKNVYYQTERANYRKSYPDLEMSVIKLRIVHRATRLETLMGGGSTLLDVGCGEGFVLAYFHRNGWQVSGIDFSVAGVEQMNPECIKFVEKGDVFSLLDAQISQGKRYDAVWLGNVLEHVLDPLALMRSLRKLVSPDGVLVVTVPNDGNLYHESLLENELIPERWWIAIPDHISYFTAESLKHTAKATGWDCLALHGDFPIDWFLAHKGSNYVVDKTQGPLAHQARLHLEYIIGQAGIEKANSFYESLANLGLGRDITAFLRPNP